ncbi:MAG: hypothetical protein WCR06_05605 [bacterium]
MKTLRMITALWLATLAATVIAADETRTNAITHRFLAVDDGTLTLHYVDQVEPAKSWRVKFGGYCMDMQLIGSNRVALAVDSGYREFDLADGKEVKVCKGPGGLMHAIERLKDGRTVLGGRDVPGLGHGVIILDAEDKVVKQFALPGVQWIRHLRSTVRGTLIIAAVNTVLECDLDGKVIWSAAVPGNNFKAVELDEQRVLVSCGPGGRTLRTIDHEGKVLATLDGKDLKEGNFVGFQRLANGNLVVANWLGHGSEHNWLGLFEYNAAGAVVWNYGVEKSSFVEVIVLDGLDTKVPHAQQVNGVLGPVRP